MVAVSASTPAPSSATGAVIQIPVTGLSCASCVGRVEAALKRVPGVSGASVNLATGRARIAFEGQSDATAAVEAIEAAGYAVPMQTISFGIDGMSCASCVTRVEQVLKRVPGVTTASVNLATRRATVGFPVDVVSEARLHAAVAAVGYAPQSNVAPAERQPDQRANESVQLRRDLLVAIALAAPVFMLEMGGHLVPALHDAVEQTFGRSANWTLQAVLTLLVLAWPGRRFFRAGLPALMRGDPDMNALVVVGTSAATAYSLAALMAPQLFPPGTANVYFEAAALIIVLILLGRFLEARAKGRTGAAIQRLLSLTPKTACVLRDGQEDYIPVAALAVGDIVRVRPGESVAADGVVVAGSSFIDESMITGESRPVAKAQTDVVVGGTVNAAGSVDIRVMGIGADTVVARIVQLVEEAQGAKLPIQAAVDRVTAWFVPAVMAAAAGTFLLWLAFGPAPSLSLALVNAVAVLVIACPCAMGLATPTSIMVGTGRAAEHGILFRQGDALQVLHDVTVVAFDKTGTLTEGRPRLTDFVVAAGFDRDAVLAQVAALEARSEHPIASALVAAASDRGPSGLQVEAFEALPGLGLSGRVEGRRIDIGADRFMAQRGIDFGVVSLGSSGWADQGKTPIYVAVDGQAAAALAVSDPIRAGAVAAVTSLRELGITVAMVTGDNGRTAQAVAAQLGIAKVVAEVLPAGKVAAVRELRTFGPVAFVGDGINDAPALAEANIGIAIGTGTDIAVESADVVLMGSDLASVVTAITLSRAVMRNIRQNLFWAFAYNVALIPIAAGALAIVGGPLLSPVLAAGAMALSSVFVVVNALRLRRFAPARFTPRTVGSTRKAPSPSRLLQPNDNGCHEHR